MKFLITMLLISTITCAFSQEIIREKTDTSRVYYLVDEAPKYPGGQVELLRYLATVEYPPFARANNIEGVVYVSFVIDMDGKVTDVIITKGADETLNEAAINHIQKMKNWTPGQLEGKAVKVRYNLPIRFKLLDDEEFSQRVKADKIYNNGVEMFKKNKYKSALGLFEKAYKLNNKDYEALFNIGVCNYKLGKIDAACESWRIIRRTGRDTANELIEKHCK